MKQKNGSKKIERRKPDMKTKTDQSNSPEPKSNTKEDLKSIPLGNWRKNWSHPRMVSLKPRQKNG